LIFVAHAQASDGLDRSRIAGEVDRAISAVMAEYDVPGMAVGITVEGRRFTFNYGVAAKDAGRKVVDDTLFEIGSISKTFTATLGAYAQARGALSLTDKASKHLPALAGSSFDRISLLDLGTYAAGGLPLQFPRSVNSRDEMLAYFRQWRPAHAAGTHRVYSNPSIGLFGHLAARSLGEPFEEVMEGKLFPMLGLARTHIRVPPGRMDDYALGYSKAGKPVRASRGVLGPEAYGVKTTAADLLTFLEANMDGAGLDRTLREAIATTQTGYYRVGNTTQGLGWEMYAYPTDLDRLLAGNSAQMALKPNKVTRFEPPLPPRRDVLVNKTGSTNGFGAYAAFVPSKRIGIVLLANRNYPIPARVKAAHRILSALTAD
jgi:beta-lactamase class C